MGKEVVVYIHSKTLLIHKNQANPTIYTKWRDLEDLMLSDINWTEKASDYMVIYMWNLKKTKMQSHRMILDVVTRDRGWGEEKLKEGSQSYIFPDMIDNY